MVWPANPLRETELEQQGTEVAKTNICVGGTAQHTNQKRLGHIRLSAWQPVVLVSTNLFDEPGGAAWPVR